jgi:hypothetical protein
VCKRETGTKTDVKEVHEKVQTAAALSALRQSVSILETGAKRESGILLLQERRIAELKNAAGGMKKMALALAEKQFKFIYPKIKSICNTIDQFRGEPHRRVAAEDGTHMFIYADVKKMELDSLQVVAGFVRASLTEQLVSARVLQDLAKLMEVRRKLFRKIASNARAWKVDMLEAAFTQIGVCERLNKQRRRSEELCVSSLGVVDLRKFERYKREMGKYNDALRGRQLKLYLDCLRIDRRCKSEGDAMEQENEYLAKIDLLCKEELKSCEELMKKRETEIEYLWTARNDRIEHETNEYHEERRVTALKRGSKHGTMRASRFSKQFKEKKKRVRRCKYYYEKILAGRKMVKKVELTDDDRWERAGNQVVAFLHSVTHLKEIVQHRKPQQKYERAPRASEGATPTTL